jgi:hypothetical protein
MSCRGEEGLLHYSIHAYLWIRADVYTFMKMLTVCFLGTCCQCKDVNDGHNAGRDGYAYCCAQSIVGHGYKSFYLTTVSPPPFILPLLTVVPNLARLSLSRSGAISTMRWPGSSSPISPSTAWHQPLAPGL